MTKKLLFLLATLLIAAGMSLAQGTGASGSSSSPSDQTGASSGSQTSSGSAGQTGSSSSSSDMGTQGSATSGSQGSATSGSQGSYGSSSGQTGSSGSMGASGQAGTTGSENSGKMKGEKTLKGCIQSSGAGQYTLQEKGGKSVTLNSTEDLSAHVGHEVKVHGTYGSGASASASASSSGASANAGETFNVTKVDMVSEQCKIKGASSSSTPPSGK